MTDFTSAKSRLIRPGVVIRFRDALDAESSTWSADLNASSTVAPGAEMDSSRSFGMTMRVSNLLAQLCDPGLGLRGAAPGPRR